jgi:hypothetical protein
MVSHALPLRDLHCQDLYVEAMHARRLKQLVPASTSEKFGALHHFAELRSSVVAFLASIRSATHLPSRATAS